MKKLLAIIIPLCVASTLTADHQNNDIKKFHVDDIRCSGETPSKKDKMICKRECQNKGLSYDSTRCSRVIHRMTCYCK